jgi:hypothetical protein
VSRTPLLVARLRTLVLVGLAACIGLGPPVVRSQDQPPGEARPAGGRPMREAAGPDQPWRAFGRVTDQEGRPLAGVEV